MHNPNTIAGLGLTEEVALLRAAIRRLACAEPDDTLRDLAELRQQVVSLSAALRTRHGLARATSASRLARVLDELGAELEPAS